MSRVGGTFTDFNAAGRKIARDIDVILDEIHDEMRQAIQKDLLPVLRRRTPVAEPGTLTSWSRADYPGQMRAMWRAIPGAPEIGLGTIITNAAPHATLVDTGWASAKQGVTVPALREITRNEDSLTRRVLRKVEAELG